MASHYLNQCLIILNWALRKKLQWNFNQNKKLFIHENVSEYIVCETAAILSRVRWVKSGITWSDIGYRGARLGFQWYWPLLSWVWITLGNQNHGCRCPGSWSRQVISRFDIDHMIWTHSFSFCEVIFKNVHDYVVMEWGKIFLFNIIQRAGHWRLLQNIGYKIDGLMQKRRNSSALAVELCLFCIKPLKCLILLAQTVQSLS